ncbi:tail fiber protein [Acaryochloris sp. IP29b_bin.137]|uniref:phage tail protein n=1 Tax=Acaryochloris sp. IP29b_bin.137 TaxID=2969217 RepID=UPI002616B7DB|nr:tail fiber protein [Acaryochloris sp. IP29b_bin.137]
MTEPYIGEIRMFGGNFAPVNWAFCDGSLLAVNQYDALFSLLGTIYGGDGRTTFGLPDLRGRIPLHYGSGVGLTTRNLGSKGGAESVTLTTAQLPSHNHGNLQGTTSTSVGTTPSGRVPGTNTSLTPYATSGPDQVLNSGSVSLVGGSSSHSNLMPTLAINFIIALSGIYPSRN